MTRSEIKFCFVIMPFEEKFKKYYFKIIKPLLKSFNIECIRSNEIYTPSAIFKDIFENIEKASFLIADMTGRNSNVSYELGVAHALNKPVIIVSQLIDDIPFDFRHLRIIIYSNQDSGEDLQSKLELTIQTLLESRTFTPVYSFKNDFAIEKLNLINYLREIYIQYRFSMSQENSYYITDNKRTILNRLYTITPENSMSHFYQVFRIDNGKIGNFKVLNVIDPNTKNELKYVYDKITDTEFRFCILLNNLEPPGKPFMIDITVQIDDYFSNLFAVGQDYFGEMPINVNKVH